MISETFTIDTDEVAADVRRPPEPRGLVVLAHGAGSDRNSAILTAVAASLTEHGLAVARIDLPYRRDRPKGPPSPSKADRDRDGIRAAIGALREVTDGPLIVGGHSYGGRQASILAADEPGIADGLLLTSYPLHPPGKPERLRSDHFPAITVPTVIVHGRSDRFGTSAEFADALALFTAPVRLVEIDKADHSLKPDRSGVATAQVVDQWLLPLLVKQSSP